MTLYLKTSSGSADTEPPQGKTLSYLQQQHQLGVLGVGGDVERRLVELTERVHVSSVFDEGLCHAVVSVLRRPVQSRHLQHVFGVDVCAALKVHTVTFALEFKSQELAPRLWNHQAEKVWLGFFLCCRLIQELCVSL